MTPLQQSQRMALKYLYLQIEAVTAERKKTINKALNKSRKSKKSRISTQKCKENDRVSTSIGTSFIFDSNSKNNRNNSNNLNYRPKVGYLDRRNNSGLAMIESSNAK